MSSDLYDDHDRERYVPEAPKRVDAPERLPFERDRARVVHAASTRRLAAKTQVMGPQHDDFVRNRLTHSLEVAQVARDLARALGCHPDVTETAALAHDLGHPPFGHNGERLLDELAETCGGFEGNAQTLRILTRLESKSFDSAGRSVGLNLTRATLDACTKYPWFRAEAPAARGVHGDGTPRTGVKFGVYDDDAPLFAWMRAGRTDRRRCLEAQVMDLADDIAYSVHDVEDAVVAGRVDLALLERPEERAQVAAAVQAWYLPEASPELIDDVVDRFAAMGTWPRSGYDHSRRGLAALKNLTSDLIGRFCGAAQQATWAAAGTSAPARYGADLVVPEQTLAEIAVLKGIAAHYVMQAQDRVLLMERQRELLNELVHGLHRRGAAALQPAYADDWAEAPDDAGRLRVVIDQVASLTDASAASWHARL